MAFEYVKDAHLQFNGALEKRQKTNLIVLHHSEGGSAETVESIHELHQSEGHKGIDYNLCVLKNGDVYNGRGLEMIGGHTMDRQGLPTYGVNERSVGIVCLGNFNKEQMGDAQKQALKRLAADVVRNYGLSSISQILTHREIAGADYTDCPGKYFPADEVRDYILHGGSAAPTPDDPKIWEVTVGDLNFRESPDLKAKVVCMLHRGDKVQLERYVEGEDWARVTVGGKTGWVWLKFIGE